MSIGENMKKLIYQVYVGKKSNLYDHCTASVKSYASKIGADYIQQTSPKLMIKPDVFQTNRSKESYEKYGGYLPIYEKENAFDYFSEYDQIAIIDADVYIRPTAPDVFKELKSDTDFAGVIERDMPITTKYAQKITGYSRMQYGSPSISKLFSWNDRGADFYNMGIMIMNKSIYKYINQSAKDFITRPEFKGFVDGLGPWKWSTDQTLLNYWVKKERMNAQNLSYKWNGLYGANVKIQHCHFVHFFLKDHLPNKGENVDQLMKDIQ